MGSSPCALLMESLPGRSSEVRRRLSPRLTLPPRHIRLPFRPRRLSFSYSCASFWSSRRCRSNPPSTQRGPTGVFSQKPTSQTNRGCAGAVTTALGRELCVAGYSRRRRGRSAYGAGLSRGPHPSRSGAPTSPTARITLTQDVTKGCGHHMKAPTCLSYLGNGLADAILLTLSSLCPRALRRHNNIVTMREEG